MLAAPSHWEMLSRVKTWDRGEFCLKKRGYLSLLCFLQRMREWLLRSLEKDISLI